MKFVVVFLSLVALGYTSPLVDVGRTVTIVVGDDGTITVEGFTGTRIFISRNLEHRGPRNIEIFSEDATSPMKRIWVDQETSNELMDSPIWEGKTEVDILVEIFKRWEGKIDVALYEALLKRIMICIQNGHINMVVYKILKCVSVEYVSLEHCVFGSGLIDTTWPRFWSRMNRLGMEVPVGQRMFKDMSGIQTLTNQITGVGERRNSFGQDSYMMRSVIPDTTTVIQSLPVGTDVYRQNLMMRLVQSVPDVNTIDRQGFMVPMVRSVPDMTTIERQGFMLPMVRSVPGVTTVDEKMPIRRVMIQSVPDDSIVY